MDKIIVSRTLKVRICLTTFNVQPSIAPLCDSQPPYQFVCVPIQTLTSTSYVYSKNEEEENEEIDLQAP